MTTQHGTAVVVLAAMINALKLVNKRLEDVKVVTSGARSGWNSRNKTASGNGIKKRYPVRQQRRYL